MSFPHCALKVGEEAGLWQCDFDVETKQHVAEKMKIGFVGIDAHIGWLQNHVASPSVELLLGFSARRSSMSNVLWFFESEIDWMKGCTRYHGKGPHRVSEVLPTA